MNEQMPDAVHEGADAAKDDLGASENKPLLHPDQGGQEGQPRQPRPDEVEPGEPLGTPEAPAKRNGLDEDPSRLQGDSGEDEM